VKPKLNTHKECGLRFHPLLHTAYTVGCLSVLKVLCPFRRPVTALDYVLFKDIRSRKYIFAEYNQQDATFLNLFISVRCCTCFRRFFRPSSGAQNCTYSVRYWSDTVCAVLSSWWWTGNSSEICRASFRNK